MSRPSITGRKPKNASPPKGTRPGHVTRSAVAERRPKERTAHDPRRARHGSMQRRAAKTTERPDQNARRRSARSRRQPLRTMRKTARVNGLRRCVGGGSSQSKGVRGRRRQRSPTNDRSGIAGESMAATGRRDVASEHCRGQEPQERRPVDHDFREVTPLVACSMRTVHSTGPAAPMSASWCPKGRSRAGASKRTPACEVSRTRTHQGASERQPDDCERPKPMRPHGFSGSVLHADETRGRDERPDRQRPAAHRHPSVNL